MIFKVSEAVACLEQADLVLEKGNFNSNLPVKNINIDNRRVSQEDLFIAYKGVSFDSHTVLDGIWQVKCPLVIIEDPKISASLSGKPFVLVKNSRDAWGYLEALACGNPQNDIDIFAVTGTNGKTSSTWLMKDLLKPLGHKVFVIGTMGAFFDGDVFETTHTTPDPKELFNLLRMAVNKGASSVAMEVSSHALVQNKLGPIRFSGGLFTSFSRDHLDFHKTMEAYLSAKLSLFEHYMLPGAKSILNDSIRDSLSSHSFLAAFYGRSEDNDWTFKIAESSLDGATLCLEHEGKRWNLEIPLVGDFILENLVGVIALTQELWEGNDLNKLCQHLSTIPGRLERVSNKSGPKVFVDYAHTPDALKTCIEAIKPKLQGKLYVVFGCGGDRDKGKRKLMGEISSRNADMTFITSDNPRSEPPEIIIDDIFAGVPKELRSKVKRIIDRKAAIEEAIESAEEGDCVLIAGKGHESYQIIGANIIDFDDVVVARGVMDNKNESN